MQLSPITPVGADDSVSAITDSCGAESVCPPEVGVLVSPLVDVSSDLTADVLRTVSPLPSVEGLLQDMLWAPVAPRSPDVDDRHATPVARWRLAREGPFIGGWMCLPEYDLSEFGLHCAIGGVRSSHASPAVSRVDWGSSIGQSSRDGSGTVVRHSFTGSGYGSRHSVAAGRRSDAD